MSKKLMRKKLALMLANLKKKRPFYTEVEYLESTGTQWIDGIYTESSNTQKLRVVCRAINIDNLDIFGNVGNTTTYVNGTKIVGITNSSNAFLYYKPTGNRILLTLEDVLLDPVIIDTTWNKTTSTMTISNGITSASSEYSGLNSGNVYKMFWRGATNLSPSSGKIYFLQVYENDVLVRDFIPVLDWDMTPCMYDRVTEQLFYNAGTGDFTAGRQIIPVEYLEGTGTQYIDTGVRGFADFEIGIQLRNNVSNVSIFCGHTYRLERYNASNPYWRFRNDNDFYNSGIPITEYHIMSWKNDEVYADGVKLQDFAKTWNVSANMTLFGASTSGSYSYPSMIYFCKLWNPTDGTLLRDYIPCKDENNVGYMFDKVTHSLYANAGTGSFVVGRVKEEEYE